MHFNKIHMLNFSQAHLEPISSVCFITIKAINFVFILPKALGVAGKVLPGSGYYSGLFLSRASRVFISYFLSISKESSDSSYIQVVKRSLPKEWTPPVEC